MQNKKGKKLRLSKTTVRNLEQVRGAYGSSDCWGFICNTWGCATAKYSNCYDSCVNICYTGVCGGAAG